MDKQIKLQGLGRQVRNYRLKNNQTQLELAHKSDVDRNYIGMLERGERNPSFLTLMKIAQGLGISISQLLDSI